VADVAQECDVTGSQIALAWLLSKPYVTAPIIGATKLEHLEQSLAAFEIKLSEEQIKKLEGPYKPHPVLGHS
jgi:aryl-alcohol dehydrogenase-like predicted oxidoreductase